MNITKEANECVKMLEQYQDLEDAAMEDKKVVKVNQVFDLVAQAEQLIYENPNDQELGGKLRELFRKW
jgi:hypothetical protein